MPKLILTRTHYDDIVAHAREGYPEEVCGLLSGRAGRVDAVWRARNVAANARLDYEMDPQTLLKQFEFEAQGQELVAIYHSHPASPAYPSATDALRAYYPESLYVICSLADQERPTMRAFRMVQGETEPAPQLPSEAERVRGQSDLLVRYVSTADKRLAHYELYFITQDQEARRQIVEVEEAEIEVV